MKTQLAQVYHSLVGLRIVEVRKLTPTELAREYWDLDTEAYCLVFDDGTRIYASRDEEGNGPGELIGIDGTPAKEGFFVNG